MVPFETHMFDLPCMGKASKAAGIEFVIAGTLTVRDILAITKEIRGLAEFDALALNFAGVTEFESGFLESILPAANLVKDCQAIMLIAPTPAVLAELDRLKLREQYLPMGGDFPSTVEQALALFGLDDVDDTDDAAVALVKEVAN